MAFVGLLSDNTDTNATVPKGRFRCFRQVMKAWEATDPAMTAKFLLELVREEKVWRISHGTYIFSHPTHPR